jgi:hypothetical protein
MCSGRALARQNNDEPHVEQNPYSTAGSGECHFRVVSLVKWTALTGDAVPAM